MFIILVFATGLDLKSLFSDAAFALPVTMPERV
jgi:hypothetical protein